MLGIKNAVEKNLDCIDKTNYKHEMLSTLSGKLYQEDVDDYIFGSIYKKLFIAKITCHSAAQLDEGYVNMNKNLLERIDRLLKEEQ